VLIEQTDRPLSEIALEVGFSDQSHFTRMFSRLARQTPRAYRHDRR
jgi:AraC-like DNA-binding protein